MTKLNYEPEPPPRETDPVVLALSWVGCTLAGAVGGAVLAALVRWQGQPPSEVWNTIGGKALAGVVVTLVPGMPVLLSSSLRLSTKLIAGVLVALSATFALCYFVLTSW